MQTSFKKIDEGVLEFSVTLNKDELNGYVAEAERQVGADVELPGFRKGKAPKELIRQRIDESAIRELALEMAVSGSLKKAVAENNFDVARTENLKVQENSNDKLVYTLTLSVFPEVKLPELSSIKIMRETEEVSDKEIAEAIEVVRNMRSKFEDKDGPAEEGDRVEVDFSVMDGGKVIDGGESHNHPLIIGGKNFMPGFEDQLVGMGKGDEKKFSLTAPKDYYQKKIAGKKLDFSVKVNLVQKVIMPHLDDDFAKSLGRFADVNELRENIKSGIKQEKEEKERDKARLAVLDKIGEQVKVNPPAFLVAQQLDGMVSQFERDLRSRGLDLSMYLSQIGKGLDELKKDWEKDAQRQAKFSIILRTLIKQQNIQPDDREVELAFNEALQELVVRGQNDMNSINAEELKDRIRDRMIQDKALDYIESVCVSKV